MKLKNVDYALLTQDMKNLKSIRDRWVRCDPDHEAEITRSYEGFLVELRRIYRDSKL